MSGAHQPESHQISVTWVLEQSLQIMIHDQSATRNCQNFQIARPVEKLADRWAVLISQKITEGLKQTWVLEQSLQITIHDQSATRNLQNFQNSKTCRETCRSMSVAHHDQVWGDQLSQADCWHSRDPARGDLAWSTSRQGPKATQDDIDLEAAVRSAVPVRASNWDVMTRLAAPPGSIRRATQWLLHIMFALWWSWQAGVEVLVVFRGFVVTSGEGTPADLVKFWMSVFCIVQLLLLCDLLLKHSQLLLLSLNSHYQSVHSYHICADRMYTRILTISAQGYRGRPEAWGVALSKPHVMLALAPLQPVAMMSQTVFLGKKACLSYVTSLLGQF